MPGSTYKFHATSLDTGISVEGVMSIADGQIRGFDQGRATYIGSYKQTPNDPTTIDITLTVRVGDYKKLVSGTPISPNNPWVMNFTIPALSLSSPNFHYRALDSKHQSIDLVFSIIGDPY